MKQYDIVALGECLMDFICSAKDEKLEMEGNAGGAPANVLALASKLGWRTALISKVGADSFGEYLYERVATAGVDVSLMRRDELHPTTMAIVKLDETGNRCFSFYRDRTADVMLTKEELPKSVLQDTRIFHFGSLSLTVEPVREATFEAIRIAREAGALISYDPNLRRPLWRNLEEARAMLIEGLASANLVKMSEEELRFITGEDNWEAGIRKLNEMYTFKLLAITLGEYGSILCINNQIYRSAAFAVPCVDTTGAGDAYWGAVLNCVLENEALPENWKPEQIITTMDYANATGSLSTTKKGAIPAMPDRLEIMDCMLTTARLGMDMPEAKGR